MTINKSIHTRSELHVEVRKCLLQWSEACCHIKKGDSGCADLEKHQLAGNLSCWHLIICSKEDKQIKDFFSVNEDSTFFTDNSLYSFYTEQEMKEQILTMIYGISVNLNILLRCSEIILKLLHLTVEMGRYIQLQSHSLYVLAELMHVVFVQRNKLKKSSICKEN